MDILITLGAIAVAIIAVVILVDPRGFARAYREADAVQKARSLARTKEKQSVKDEWNSRPRG